MPASAAASPALFSMPTQLLSASRRSSKSSDRPCGKGGRELANRGYQSQVSQRAGWCAAGKSDAGGPGAHSIIRAPAATPLVSCLHSPSRRPGLPSARGHQDQGTAGLSHGCTPAGVGECRCGQRVTEKRDTGPPQQVFNGQTSLQPQAFSGAPSPQPPCPAHLWRIGAGGTAVLRALGWVAAKPNQQGAPRIAQHVSDLGGMDDNKRRAGCVK